MPLLQVDVGVYNGVCVWSERREKADNARAGDARVNGERAARNARADARHTKTKIKTGKVKGEEVNKRNYLKALNMTLSPFGVRVPS